MVEANLRIMKGLPPETTTSMQRDVCQGRQSEADGLVYEVVRLGHRYGVPVPAMSAALSYFDGYTTDRLPANLLQAQRDYFGAHTYERLDAPRGQFFHTNWTGHGGSTSASTYSV